MKSKAELIAFLQGQIKVENKIVESIDSALLEMANPTVKGALKGISLDSVKHAEMYAAAVSLLMGTYTGLTQELTQHDLDKHKKLIQKHIDIEEKLIIELSEVVPSVENKKITLLLNAILQDERKHHELLKEVLEILVRGETVPDEWWNLTDKEYVPRW